MSNSSRSVLVFGIYLLLSGLTFAFAPNAILPLLGFAQTSEVWIRLVGLLAGILGMYFINAARAGDRRFFGDTLTARLIFFSGVTLFVLLGWASPLLVLFGLIDLAGAAWTWLALRAEGKASTRAT
jgi:hypothetical protein